MVLMVVLTTTANEYWFVFVVGVHAREDLKYFAAMMVVACNFHFYAFWHATEVVSQASIINTTNKARHRVQWYKCSRHTKAICSHLPRKLGQQCHP